MSKRDAAQSELALLGDGHPESASGQGALILQLLHKYSASVSASLQGNSDDMSTTELVGGSRIRFILHEIFVKGVTSLDPTAHLTDDDIRTAIQNSAGARSTLLIPEEPFELLAKQSISKLLEPCRRCATLVHEELLRLVRRCIQADVRRFPMLTRALEEEARNFLAEVSRRSASPARVLAPHARVAGSRACGGDDQQPGAVPAVIHQHHRPQLCGRHLCHCDGALVTRFVCSDSMLTAHAPARRPRMRSGARGRR